MKRVILLLALIGVLCHSVAQAQLKNSQVKYVVLITIDGLRLEMITEKEMPSPVLKELVGTGTLVERVISVAPAMT